MCGAWNHRVHPSTGSKVVLTIMHLDHTPENCGDDNLRAACQRCHNAYDLNHRVANMKRTLAEKRERRERLAFYHTEICRH